MHVNYEQVIVEQSQQVVVSKLNDNVKELPKQRERPSVNKKALL